MNHLKAINRKAARIEQHVMKAEGLTNANGDGAKPTAEGDIVALQQGGPKPHVPMGCSLVFYPGWEVDAAGGTAGLCQPVERDLFDCYVTCFWPAHVPDHLNNSPDWSSKCATGTKDWRNIDIVFP
jgi:hypothetical protein